MTKENKSITSDALVGDVLLRLNAIERLLIAKNIITQEEFKAELKAVSGVLLKEILKQAKVPGDLDKLVEELTSIKPEIV